MLSENRDRSQRVIPGVSEGGVSLPLPTNVGLRPTTGVRVTVVIRTVSRTVTTVGTPQRFRRQTTQTESSLRFLGCRGGGCVDGSLPHYNGLAPDYGLPSPR